MTNFVQLCKLTDSRDTNVYYYSSNGILRKPIDIMDYDGLGEVTIKPVGNMIDVSKRKFRPIDLQSSYSATVRWFWTDDDGNVRKNTYLLANAPFSILYNYNDDNVRIYNHERPDVIEIDDDYVANYSYSEYGKIKRIFDDLVFSTVKSPLIERLSLLKVGDIYVEEHFDDIEDMVYQCVIFRGDTDFEYDERDMHR